MSNNDDFDDLFSVGQKPETAKPAAPARRVPAPTPAPAARAVEPTLDMDKPTPVRKPVVARPSHPTPTAPAGANKKVLLAGVAVVAALAVGAWALLGSHDADEEVAIESVEEASFPVAAVPSPAAPKKARGPEKGPTSAAPWEELAAPIGPVAEPVVEVPAVDSAVLEAGRLAEEQRQAELARKAEAARKAREAAERKAAEARRIEQERQAELARQRAEKERKEREIEETAVAAETIVKSVIAARYKIGNCSAGQMFDRVRGKMEKLPPEEVEKEAKVWLEFTNKFNADRESVTLEEAQAWVERATKLKDRQAADCAWIVAQ